MRLSAYWLANFTVDFLKVEFTVIITLFMFAVNGMNYRSVQVPLLLFPLATIPFTYVTSFMFSSVPAA
jgi:hypothetical protein